MEPDYYSVLKGIFEGIIGTFILASPIITGAMMIILFLVLAEVVPWRKVSEKCLRLSALIFALLICVSVIGTTLVMAAIWFVFLGIQLVCEWVENKIESAIKYLKHAKLGAAILIRYAEKKEEQK